MIRGGYFSMKVSLRWEWSKYKKYYSFLAFIFDSIKMNQVEPLKSTFRLSAQNLALKRK